MAYSKNPHLPRVRMEAVKLVRGGWSMREVARHFGYTHSAVVKWMRRAVSRKHLIATRSSKPHHHPHELREKIVQRILAIRGEKDQCAEVIHHRLLQEGVAVSLSSVKRTLKREGVTRYSKWKKWHTYPPRPIPETPGILVQIDSMQEGLPSEHLYAYALIDVKSRWGYAEPVARITACASFQFVQRARVQAPFPFAALQSDHGKEFPKWFTKQCLSEHLEHHHSRVRTPTDNAFVERFIQTLQAQCLNRIPRSLKVWRKEMPEFLKWYNEERPHMALGMQTPVEMLKRFQAID